MDYIDELLKVFDDICIQQKDFDSYIIDNKYTFFEMNTKPVPKSIH